MNRSRRKFLKNSLATVAGFGMASVVPGQLNAQEGQKSAHNKLIVGLIGCKNMGYTNLVDFLKQPNIECAALCDIDDEWLYKRANDVTEMTGKKPVLYKDFRKLLENKDIDARRMAAIPPQMTDNKSHENHVQNFIECVKTRQKPACDVEVGRNAALYAHLGNIAYRTGHKIIWDDRFPSYFCQSSSGRTATHFCRT